MTTVHPIWHDRFIFLDSVDTWQIKVESRGGAL